MFFKAIARKLGAVRCTSKILFRLYFTDSFGALHLKIKTIKVQRTSWSQFTPTARGHLGDSICKNINLTYFFKVQRTVPNFLAIAILPTANY